MMEAALGILLFVTLAGMVAFYFFLMVLTTIDLYRSEKKK